MPGSQPSFERIVWRAWKAELLLGVLEIAMEPGPLKREGPLAAADSWTLGPRGLEEGVANHFPDFAQIRNKRGLPGAIQGFSGSLTGLPKIPRASPSRFVLVPVRRPVPKARAPMYKVSGALSSLGFRV